MHVFTTSHRIWIRDVVAWLFIFLWMYAASSKLLDHERFIVQLGQSPLIMPISGFVGWFIPLAEVVVAGLLFFERYRIMGLYTSYGLMVMFTAYIVVITQYSDYVPCSCGGILQNMTWSQHLAFNTIFTVLAAMAILLGKSAYNNISLQRNRGIRKPA